MSSRITPDGDSGLPNAVEQQNSSDPEQDALKVVEEIKRLVQPFGNKEEGNILMGKLVKAKLITSQDEFHAEFLLEYFQPLLSYLKDADKDFSAHGYRTAATDETTLILEKFSKFEHSEKSPGEPIKTIEEFAALETETWLDIAFIKAAMQQSALTASGAENTAEAAKLLFGEDSQLGKRLLQFKKADKYEDLRSGILFLYGAILMALEAAAVVLGAELGVTLQPVFAVLLALGATIAALMMAYGIHRYRTPYPGTRKYLRNQYGKIEVPHEAKRFTDLAFAMKDSLKKLQSTPNEGERAAMLQELKSLADEMKGSVAKNSNIFKGKANKSEPKPKLLEKLTIRMEEFEESATDDELPVAVDTTKNRKDS